jgi:hypothetical protein
MGRFRRRAALRPGKALGGQGSQLNQSQPGAPFAELALLCSAKGSPASWTSIRGLPSEHTKSVRCRYQIIKNSHGPVGLVKRAQCTFLLC